jgi:hypothetical protein
MRELLKPHLSVWHETQVGTVPTKRRPDLEPTQHQTAQAGAIIGDRGIS